MRCNTCGAELAPEDRFCRECGAPRPQVPRRFDEAERRFAALRARRQAGELDDAAYEAELQRLVIEDDVRGYWMLGADSGEWYWYDGNQWVRRNPAASAPLTPSAPPPPSGPPSARAFPWTWLAVGCGGLLALFIVAGLLLVPRLLPAAYRGPEPALIVTDTMTPSATATSLYAEMTAAAALPAPTTSAVEPTAKATPTSLPTKTPASTPTPSPTPEESPTVTPSPEPTTTATVTPQPRATSGVPGPTSPPASGALIDFEQWGNWRRGDQPYGELVQTESQVHSGSYAAKLRYDFPVTDDDFVVFARALSLAGQPNRFNAWVYGDGSGNYLNIWIEDAQGETWAVHLGQIGSAGWRSITGTLDPQLAWPSGHVYGPENGIVDYPIKFYALVLDRVGGGPRSGQIYIDDISVWRSEAGTAVTPSSAEATPTTTAETPVSAGPLDFPEPTSLDAWERADGGYRVTIIVRISGGASPFTIQHDIDTFVTDKRDYPLVFSADKCVIVKTIVVDSADGQRVSHDYYIRAPWCD